MYRELIRTICASLTGGSISRPDLILLPAWQEPQLGQGGTRRQARFEIPDEFLPDGSEPIRLSPNEAFLKEADEYLKQKSPRVALVIPPLVRDSELSPEWRRNHHSQGLIETLAEHVFYPPIQPAADQLELFGSQDNLRRNTLDMLILFVSRSVVDSKRNGEWRARFFKSHATTVIEHDHELKIPGFGLPFHQRFRAVTLVIQAGPGPTRFLKIRSEAIDAKQERILEDLSQLLNRRGGETEFGYVYRENLTPNYPTTYDFYSPATQAIRASIKDLSQKIYLGEVADILTSSCRVPSAIRHTGAQGSILFISGRNILANGEFDFSVITRRTPSQKFDRVPMLEEGDICVRRIRSVGGAQFVAAAFPGYMQPLAFDHSIIVIRPKPFLEHEQRLVILAFLRSPVARDLFVAKGDSIMLSYEILNRFPVPLADADLITAIKGLTEARDAFAAWSTSLNRELSNIVSTRNMAENRLKVLTAGQLARQRFRVAQEVESLDYRIRTQYPLPLAYLWLDWRVSSPDPYHRLRNILKAAEGLACFFALIAVMAGRISNVKIGYTDSIANRLADRPGGTNFGDWFAILKEVGDSRKFREILRSVPFFEVTELMRSTSFAEAMRSLMTSRNDDSHGRILPQAVPSNLLKKLEADLTVVYEEVGFIADYRLIQIKRTWLDSFRQQTKFEFADLTGDNPLVQIQLDQTNQTDLEVDSLYMRDRTGVLHLVRPFLHYLECPDCHLMSTFYLDTYGGTGAKVKLKSFERNSVREEPFAEDFKWVGLLKGG